MKYLHIEVELVHWALYWLHLWKELAQDKHFISSIGIFLMNKYLNEKLRVQKNMVLKNGNYLVQEDLQKSFGDENKS